MLDSPGMLVKIGTVMATIILIHLLVLPMALAIRLTNACAHKVGLEILAIFQFALVC
jgi:hypothetical protein